MCGIVMWGIMVIRVWPDGYFEFIYIYIYIYIFWLGVCGGGLVVYFASVGAFTVFRGRLRCFSFGCVGGGGMVGLLLYQVFVCGVSRRWVRCGSGGEDGGGVV